MTQVWDLAHGLVEFLMFVLVPLDGIPSFYCIKCTTELGVISKHAEGTLNPTV